MKIGLGTVQFGLSYGISNSGGQTTSQGVSDILSAAVELGVRVVDTAPAYGSSEEAIGAAMRGSNEFDMITKTFALPPGSVGQAGVRQIESVFHESLAKLRVDRVYGLLVHNADSVLGPDGDRVFSTIQGLKASGLVRRIGVSVYSAQQIDRIMDRYQIDLIQLPLNVFDQRLIASGHLSALKRAGVEIHARSAFLQGLLLMSPTELPDDLYAARDPLASFRRTAALNGLTPLAAAIQFVLSLEEIDCVVCGVNSREHLQEICQAAALGVRKMDWTALAIDDERIVNPARWRSQ